MGKGDNCEVCGGSDMNLVDGFYYCMECGTQDKNTQETISEFRPLADGTFTTSSKHKIRAKVKEGVEMSREWYKWHTYNFIIAGLADELVALGAAPSVKMKLLWIWSRYIKTYQKKEEMGKTHALSQLESSESEASDAAGAAPETADGGPTTTKLHRPNRLLLVAFLLLALNQDRSRLQLSDLLRLVKYRLLSVNDTHKFVPDEIDIKKVEGYEAFRKGLVSCWYLTRWAVRLGKKLELGPPVTPDVEALVAARLTELRLPLGLRALVRALMVAAPVPFRSQHRLAADGAVMPDYEGVVAAYVLVALKMCLGLDDEREARLSTVAEGVNERERRRRLYAGDADGADPPPLFSFREWAEHVQFREQALCDRCAPLAWDRGRLADDYAFIEHFEGFSARPVREARGGRDVGDEVTMEVLRRIPAPPPPAVLPLAAAAACLASETPLTALAAAVAPRLPAAARRRLAEDFPRYDLDYAFRRLALRDARGREHVAGGVGPERKTFRDRLGVDLLVEATDQTTVHVKNCENKNWIDTVPRLVPASGDRDDVAYPDGDVPSADGDVASADGDVASADGDVASADGDGRDAGLETFDEEEDGRNIFDDDFLDVRVKEEIENEDAAEDVDDTKDDIVPDVPHEHGDRSDGAAPGGGDVFDSDDEAARFDPAAFDRTRIVRNIMVEAYREHRVPAPVRFKPKEEDKTRRELAKRPKKGDFVRRSVTKRSRLRRAAAVDALLADYRRGLQHDALHHAADALRAAVHDAERDLTENRSPDVASDVDISDVASAISSGSHRVELIENNLNENESDSSDGAAEDPVAKGDARFDAATHDTRRLFVRLDAPAAADDDDDYFSDGDAALVRLLDDKVRGGVPTAKHKKQRRKPERFAARLVDDPKDVPEMNYWFKRYLSGPFTMARVLVAMEKEMDESFPRSFRIALRWCAAAAALPPVDVYRHVMDIERQIEKSSRRRAAPMPRPADEDPTRKKRKRRVKRKTEVADENTEPRAAKRKKEQVKPETGDSDDASSERRGRDRSDMSAEEVPADDDEPAPDDDEPAPVDDEPAPDTPARRSRRLRDKSLTDPFWR